MIEDEDFCAPLSPEAQSIMDREGADLRALAWGFSSSDELKDWGKNEARQRLAALEQTQNNKKECLMSVARSAVFDALAQLVEIEERAEASDDYQAVKQHSAGEVASAISVLGVFAEEMQPASLGEMQREFYAFTEAEQFQGSTVARISVRSYLSAAWHQIGPWRK